MADQGLSGIGRLIKAFGYSMAGLRAAFANEQAFRLECYCLLILLPLALWLGDTGVQRALLAGSLLMVPLMELINSAIEAVVDRFGAERHELAGRAKDIGSAAVLLAIVMACGTWGLVLL